MSDHEMLKTLYPLIISEPEYRDPSLKAYEVAAKIIKRQNTQLVELRREVAKLHSEKLNVGENTRWFEL